MLVVVQAIDTSGNTVATAPLTEKDALMKIWEFKTSGYTQIKTFDSATNEEVTILRRLDPP
jgi:hypothetical protein